MFKDATNFPKVTFILRDYSYEQVEKIAEILLKSSFKSLEIALKDDGSKRILKKLVDKYADHMIIGAGTVLTKKDLFDVIKIGVKFVISPVFDKKMIKICNENDVICIPGAYSPTEIFESFRCGADIVKVFPASILTYKYFKSIKAPLESIKLMAVGGVNENNVLDFLENGADYVGVGSGIINRKEIEKGNFNGLKRRISKLEKSLMSLIV